MHWKTNYLVYTLEAITSRKRVVHQQCTRSLPSASDFNKDTKTLLTNSNKQPSSALFIAKFALDIYHRQLCESAVFSASRSTFYLSMAIVSYHRRCCRNGVGKPLCEGKKERPTWILGAVVKCDDDFAHLVNNYCSRLIQLFPLLNTVSDLPDAFHRGYQHKTKIKAQPLKHLHFFTPAHLLPAGLRTALV